MDYPTDATLITLFEQQVARTPDALALQFGPRTLSYRELNERANQLAHYLRSVGVSSECFVGVCMERSLELVIALYGILKAGAAYVPLDPDYPQERLAHMLQDAAIDTLLCQARLADQLPAHQARTISLDTDWDTLAISAGPRNNPPLAARPDNAAYVIFTSGSTGRPKGVINEHRGICNRLLWMQDEYQLNGTDRVLQKTPFSFDVSVWEFFWPLQTGASLIVAEPGGHRDTAYLAELMRTGGITTLHFVPSMLRSSSRTRRPATALHLSGSSAAAKRWPAISSSVSSVASMQSCTIFTDRRRQQSTLRTGSVSVTATARPYRSADPSPTRRLYSRRERRIAASGPARRTLDRRRAGCTWLS